MKLRWLTESAMEKWLLKCNNPVNPYLQYFGPDNEREQVQPFFLQMEAADGFGSIESFLDCFIEEVLYGEDFIVHLYDPEPSKPSYDFVVDSIRQSSGVSSTIAETPACYCTCRERDGGIAVFGLACSFGWKSYIYGATGQTTLFNWEGEYLDFWCSDEAKYQRMIELVKNFSFSIVRTQQPVSQA